MKNIVGRIAGKGAAPQDRSPASSGHGTPPRHEPSHRTSSPDRNDDGSGGKKRRRRGGKAKADAAPWSLEQFQVDPKEGFTRFHDLGAVSYTHLRAHETF